MAGLRSSTDSLSDTVGHCVLGQAVKDNKELREAVEEVQPEVVAVSLRLSQSKPVYEAFQSLKEGSSWSKLTEAQQRIVDKNLREFTLGGVALEVSLFEPTFRVKPSSMKAPAWTACSASCPALATAKPSQEPFENDCQE